MPHLNLTHSIQSLKPANRSQNLTSLSIPNLQHQFHQPANPIHKLQTVLNLQINQAPSHRTPTPIHNHAIPKPHGFTTTTKPWPLSSSFITNRSPSLPLHHHQEPQATITTGPSFFRPLQFQLTIKPQITNNFTITSVPPFLSSKSPIHHLTINPFFSRRQPTSPVPPPASQAPAASLCRCRAAIPQAMPPIPLTHSTAGFIIVPRRRPVPLFKQNGKKRPESQRD